MEYFIENLILSIAYLLIDIKQGILFFYKAKTEEIGIGLRFICDQIASVVVFFYVAGFVAGLFLHNLTKWKQ
jgi:hypothetical protein